MSEAAAWDDAALVAALCGLDPLGVGGVALCGLAGPVRDRWLELLRESLPAGAPVRRVPLHVGDERLLGGLDLAATLQAGRPVTQAGLLAAAGGGVVVLAMAERLPPATAARIVAGLDADGFAAVALDESLGDDERLPPALLDRLAFRLDLHAIAPRTMGAGAGAAGATALAAARDRFADVTTDDSILAALCGTALALGVWSLRASLLSLRVARLLAALAGRDAVADTDAAVAARLVLAWRATQLPQHAAEPPASDPDGGEPPAETDTTAADQRPLEDVVLQAAAAAIPTNLLADLASGRAAVRKAAAGRAGTMQATGLRGRPAGVRRGMPGPRARLNVIETLRAAAPWQRLRVGGGRLQVRRDDFRVTRYRQRTGTTTIFAVDASGSAALHRLAETKGAVELLLAESYARRDQVAVLAFRGVAAELLLPPTRSLVRAKRSLAALPGGGGTPLATAIDAAAVLADAVRRRGTTPIVVLLTDGRANIARDGSPGRARAEADALAASRRLAEIGVAVLLVDTSPKPYPAARRLAEAMGGRYLPLPQADAAAMSRAVRRQT